MTDKELIEQCGGTKAFADILGVTVQRVTNWKRRGIPAKVKLDNLSFFQNLQQQTTSHKDTP